MPCVPAFTLVILLPPLFKPLSVKLTLLLPVLSGVMVMPVPLNVASPPVTGSIATILFKPLKSLASFRRNELLLASASTAIFSA